MDQDQGPKAIMWSRYSLKQKKSFEPEKKLETEKDHLNLKV